MFNHYYYHIWYLKVKQLKYCPILDTISTFYIIRVFALSVYFHVNKLRYITASNSLVSYFQYTRLFIRFEMSLRINNQHRRYLIKIKIFIESYFYWKIIRVDFVSWFFQKEILLIFTYLFLLFYLFIVTSSFAIYDRTTFQIEFLFTIYSRLLLP